MNLREKRDAFSQSHPVINFLYFLLVIGSSMFCLQPLILGISFLSAGIYASYLKGSRQFFRRLLTFLLPGMVVVALLNPVFNHYGVTPLLILENGNRITMEAIAYGVVLAAVLGITLTWFTCYNAVMTTDKFVYLFGKILPASSLVLSMVFRFVPKFSQQLAVVRQGQKSIGRDFSHGSMSQKMKHALTIFSIMITWSLENAIETADSMKARGYGLKGRSAFSLYRFDRRDGLLLSSLLLCSGVFFYFWRMGQFYTSYNPQLIISLPKTFGESLGYLSFLILCNLPMILAVYEKIRWRQARKIAGGAGSATINHQ